MRMSKRLLSILLTLCMVIGMLPSTALAASAEPSTPDDPDVLGMLRAEQGDYEFTPGTNPVTIDMKADTVGGSDGIMLLSQADEAAARNNVNNTTARYTVLVLDRSGSMSGQPISKLKEAAANFCENMLESQTTGGNDYIALVPFDTVVGPVVQFTNDIFELTSAIASLTARGGTDLNAALEEADKLLKDVPSGATIVKNVIVLTDGLPQSGDTLDPGRYTYESTGYHFYDHANACYETARTMLWPGYNVYTLGFFHDVGNSNITFCRRFLRDLQNTLYYEVNDTDDLIFVFEDIAGDINTTDTDPIIVIPGIMGSRLWKDTSYNKQVWDPSVGTVLFGELGSALQGTLYVKPCQNQQGNSDREYGALDTYKDLVDGLCNKFPDRDVYFFSYDWRKSNEESASKLKEAIDSIVADQGVERVDLVCHSMGGLVASKYFADYEVSKVYGERTIDKVITCGTPYEGAPKLIDSVMNWNVLGDGIIWGKDNFQDLALGTFGGMTSKVKGSFAGVAELAPTTCYVNTIPMWRDNDGLGFLTGEHELNTGEYQAAMESIFPSYTSAKTFQSSIRNGDYDSNYNILLNYNKAYFVVGTNQKTVSAVVFNKTNNDINDLFYENVGDGTVPYLSATMMNHIKDQYKGEKWEQFNTTHQGVVKDENCINWVANVLETGKGTSSGVKAQKSRTVVLRIACPVDVEVTANGQTLSSKDDTCTSISSFGRLDVIGSETDPIKMLCLDANQTYSIRVTGTDEATASSTMDFTARYYDENNRLELATSAKDISVNSTSNFEVVIPSTPKEDIKVGNKTTAKVEPSDEYKTWEDEFLDNKDLDPVAGDDERAPSTPTDSTQPSNFAFVPTVTGGTVVLSKRNAEPGDWVNIYVTPDEGYKLESLTVTDMRGWPVTVREMGENAFSFTMPNARINVNPVFVKVEADDDPYSTNVPTNIPNIEGTSPNYGNMVINTAAMNYSDVNAGDWFYNNVKFCHERYLLNKTGEADGKFEPNTASTRATVWTALSRLAGRNTVTQGDNWYDRAQIWAKGKGITDGERPMDSMTREEFVTMLWRYDGNKYVQNSALGQFNDGETVSWWATEAVKWAVATGLLNGSNGSLNPQSNVTRAEVAAVLQRYVQNVH